MFDIQIYNGDLSFNSGEFTVVKNEQKMVQALVKVLITPVRSSSLRPNYGTDLTDALGQAMPDFIYLSKIEDSIRDAIAFLMNEQTKAASRQYVSAGERINQLLSVSVQRNAADLRQIDVNIVIRAGNGNIVQRQFAIAPGAFVSQTRG